MTKCKFFKLFFVFLIVFFINIIGVHAAGCTGIEIYGFKSSPVVGNEDYLYSDIKGCGVDALKRVDWTILTPDIVKVKSVGTLFKGYTKTDTSVTNLEANGWIITSYKKQGTAKIKVCIHGDSSKCHTIEQIVVSTKCSSLEIKHVQSKLNYGGQESFHFNMDDCADILNHGDWYVLSDPEYGKITKVSSGALSKDGMKATNVNGQGMVTFTAGNKDGFFTLKGCVHNSEDICGTVTVAIGKQERKEYKGLIIDGDNPRVLTVGTPEHIHADINWNGAHICNGAVGQEDEIIWESSDKKVVTIINANDGCQGLATPISAGRATIKAYLKNDSTMFNSIQVVVKNDQTTSEDESKVTSISFAKHSSTIAVGDNESFEVITNPKVSKSNIILIPTVKGPGANDSKTGTVDNKSVQPVNGCVTVSAGEKGSILVAGNKKCDGIKVKACLSTKPSVCTGDLAITVSGTVNDHIDENGEYISLKQSTYFDHTDKVYDCKALLDENLTEIIKRVMTIVQIATPILLIVMITIDFGSVVIAGNPSDKHRDSYGDTYDDAMKLAVSRTVKRVIAAIVIFFIPVLVKLLLQAPGISESTDPNCVDVFTEE